MKKKKLLIIGSIIAIVLSIALVIYIALKPKENNEFKIEGTSLPTNKEILADTTIGDLKITNVSIITRENVSSFYAKVSNETERNILVNKLYVVFYEGDLETKTLVLYNTHIYADKETTINITSEKNLNNVTKIDYILE